MSNRDQTNKEETISQQQVPTAINQRKTTRTQATQVNETNGDKGQDNRTALNRIDYSRSMGDECMQKQPFFVNHYYSHLVGQCCCQQHDMTVRKGETTVQCSTTPQPATTYKMSENLQKLQQLSEIKACTSIIQQ